MRRKNVFNFAIALAILALTLAWSTGAWAATEKVLHTFKYTGIGGCNPLYGPLVFDTAGNLYGTTSNGGETAGGTVYELSPSPKGWNQTVLYSFKAETMDGSAPYAGVTLDKSGALYGTTYAGGAHGYGTAFQLVGSGNAWTENVLYSFTGKQGGEGYPYSGLVLDSAGSLYGTTSGIGGSTCCGTAFKLSKGSDGSWSETVLHVFTGTSGGGDGAYAYSPLTFDSAGSLYGTTLYGGSPKCQFGDLVGCGVVFKLTPSKAGWSERVTYPFPREGVGWNPGSGLIFDGAGNLYGTTQVGGGANACQSYHGCGTVFELSSLGRRWTERVLLRFGGKRYPNYPGYASLVFDNAGNLYGTIPTGGADGWGKVFKLSHSLSGWKETVLHNFSGGNDGGYPQAGMILDAHGNLYGSTQYGGESVGYSGCGVVFEITP